jgi:hypothetical protein
MRTALKIGLAVPAATAMALGAGTAAAQEGSGTFRVSPHGGYTTYASETGLKPSVNLGLDALYFVSKNIGIGVLLDYARPETDSSYFPVEFSFGGSSFLDNPDGVTYVVGVNMPVSIAQYQLIGEFRFGDRLQPFISGGAGAYTMFLDPQAAAGNTNFTNWALSAGVGVSFRASAATGVRLEVRDFMFLNYDRANLQVQTFQSDWTIGGLGSYNQPVRFPDVVPAQEPFSGSAHNFQFALAFNFTPGGR